MINYFSINLNYIKRINALNNNDLCEVLDLTVSTVSKLINDKAYPTVDALLKISETFGYTIDDLLKIEIEKANKFKADYVNEDATGYQNQKINDQLEAAKTTITDLKYQIQQKDVIINNLIEDKNVFRNQAEKYLELLTNGNNKKAI